MPTDDTIRKRDQKRLCEWFLTLGSPVQSREIRVVLQYLQALDVCDLLTQSAERQAELASAALFRFGLDTLATGFWIACVATDEWLRGQGEGHIPSSLERTIATLPPQARNMLDEVVNSGFVNDSKRTLLTDVLNPAIHGDALVNVVRIPKRDFEGSWRSHNVADCRRAVATIELVPLRELLPLNLASYASRQSKLRKSKNRAFTSSHEG